ncbi:WD40 repeat protein [Streptomyces umbrinus]|uniref:WD40 repeat protein n=1 Tax=Streptomyces umbrinus TaxID=67370 RepID=A0ABU0T756_9ACTN|nr:NB-ARC domain-containing protein [Streptomyces umbrinus]MDQ1031402.1 WD40 repeat protein [Streptomyces umbrinus]
MRVRVWAAGIVALASLGIALAIVLALAGNAATEASRWPWALDELRQHPWWSLGIIGSLAVVAGGVMAWLQLHPPTVLSDPPPPPPPAIPEWFVDRDQTRATVAAVCRGRRTVGITTALSGAGGFGKTTLATAVCNHQRVRSRFRSRIYTITIGRDVRGRAAIAAKVAESTRFITGDTEEFDDPVLAGAHLGRLLDQRPRTLLVLDDVWEREQLVPFLQGGLHCVRLITTRNPVLLPSGAHLIRVDQMSQAQAKVLLTGGLPTLPHGLVGGLLRATGRWALLLRLTNRLIAEQCAAGAQAAVAAERILGRLRDVGPVAVDDPAIAWDLDDPRLRNQAVKASIEAATTLLPPGGADRFTELGIFAEDESVPVTVVALLWQASGGLTEDQTRTLCRDLERLSLLTLDPSNGGSVGVHDVIRDYLRNALGEPGLTRVNSLLIDAIAATLPPAQPLAPATPDPQRAWWQLSAGYLLDHLIDHVLAAGRTALAENVAGDVRWVENRLSQRGPTAPWADLTLVDSPHTRPLARSLAQAAHFLTPTDPPDALTGVLHNRLETHPHWHPQITARRHDPTLRPCLANRWLPPDTPHPALRRVLTGYDGAESVAISPDGTWLATTDSSGTVQIWDPTTGNCTTTLTEHSGYLTSVVISPDGTWLATSGRDRTVRIWDRTTRARTTLTGHRGPVNAVAIAPDGTWLATTSNDGTVRIWDRTTRARTTLTGHRGPVNAVAIAPDGTWLATTSNDRTVRIWDRTTGNCTTTINDMVTSLAIAPDGTWLATTSNDDTVRIWDPATGNCTTTITGHSVTSLAIAPDGTWLATTSNDDTVRIWDPATGNCTTTITGHSVTSLAIAPDGTWLATSGMNGTVRIWDRTTGNCTTTLTGHRGPVNAVVVAPDGTWLATDGGVQIWDTMASAQDTSVAAYAGPVNAVAIAPDGTWLATTSRDQIVRIWDPTTGNCTTAITDMVASVAIAPDGTWLATTSNDDTVQIWDPATGNCTTTLRGWCAPFDSVAIAPDGTWLATTSNDGTIRFWDPMHQFVVARVRTEHSGFATSLAIAPDGTWLAATSNDDTIRIIQRATRSCTGGLRRSVSSLAISPDGTWLAIVSRGHVEIWDRTTRSITSLTESITRLTEVTSVAISLNGTWLATTSDRTVRIWSVAERRTIAITRTEGALYSCAWGPDAELAVAGERGVYLYVLLT